MFIDGGATLESANFIRLLPVALNLICPAVAAPVNVGVAFGAEVADAVTSVRQVAVLL